MYFYKSVLIFFIHPLKGESPMVDENKRNNMDGKKKKNNTFIKKLWDNYIKRLNKITNGKPQCCK